MFYINTFTAARALDIVQVEKMTFLYSNIFFTILQHRVAVVTNRMPRCFFVVVVFYNLHIYFSGKISKPALM